MRTLERNKIRFAYATLSQEEIIDDYGNRTASYRQVRGEMHEAKANISPDKGSIGYELFGSLEHYDRVICYDSKDRVTLSEGDAVWIGIDRDKPHNYVVTKISASINSTLAAIKSVAVS